MTWTTTQTQVSRANVATCLWPEEECHRPRHVGERSGRVYRNCAHHEQVARGRARERARAARAARADDADAVVAFAERGGRRPPVGLAVYHTCQRCYRRVGADSLAVCLWPPPPRTNDGKAPREGKESSRFALGRARLCEECVRSTGAIVRVQARTFAAPVRARAVTHLATSASPWAKHHHGDLFARRA